MSLGQSTEFDLTKPLGQQISSGNLKSEPTAGSISLEEPIDPATYILGPGDKVELSIWGNIEIIQVLTVGPDGVISVPSIGIIPVAGITLNQANELVIENAKRVYSNSKIILRLVEIRSMKVLISGAVERPGVYNLSAIDRFSTLLNYAGGFFDPEKGAEPKVDFKSTRQSLRDQTDLVDQNEIPLEDRKPSQRQIQIIRKDGTIERIDYLFYVKTGKKDYNPILRDGDQVHVPIQDADVGVVNIFGSVKEPGEYEFVKGDRLIDIIDLASGLKSDASLNNIKLVRFNDSTGYEEELQIDLIKGFGSSRGIELQKDDRIFIRNIPGYREKFYVMVEGDVKYPGKYPIVQGVTTLSDLINTCGGFNGKADLMSAKVNRIAFADIEDPEFERLKTMSVAEMNEMEYEYYKTRSRTEAPSVVVDFKKLFDEGQNDLDILLRDRDIITVPELTETVNVAGQVNRPGLIRWVPGKNIEFYIEKAGGYSWNARLGKMRLIKAQTGTWLKPKSDTPIEIGDTIFVPEKQELGYWELWKDIMLVVSQIATVVLVIQSVR